MFGMLESLAKAVVGVVIETPVAIATDIVTMGGALNDKAEPYTVKAVKGVVKNVQDAAK